MKSHHGINLENAMMNQRKGMPYLVCLYFADTGGKFSEFHASMEVRVSDQAPVRITEPAPGELHRVSSRSLHIEALVSPNMTIMCQLVARCARSEGDRHFLAIKSESFVAAFDISNIALGHWTLQCCQVAPLSPRGPCLSTPTTRELQVQGTVTQQPDRTRQSCISLLDRVYPPGPPK